MAKPDHSTSTSRIVILPDLETVNKYVSERVKELAFTNVKVNPYKNKAKEIIGYKVIPLDLFYEPVIFRVAKHL